MILGVIPARFGSSRLFGKPLSLIGDKTMIQHTYESASKSRLLTKLIVAVDDDRVESVVRGFGGESVMTPQDIQTGSDRIAYVADQFPEAEVIVNIQGDEPFIPSLMIDKAVEPLLFDPKVNISTLAKRITTVADMRSPSVVKVVFDQANNALYFSRAAIPHVRDAITFIEKVQNAEYYKHIGLYVFRRKYLEIFTKLPQSYLEHIERLEQLRLLENGYKIKIVVTDLDSLSVDTPEDLDAARQFYKKIQKLKKKE